VEELDLELLIVFIHIQTLSIRMAAA